MRILFSLLLFVGVAMPAIAANGAPPATAEQATRAWAGVLNRYVNDAGYVDFRGLAAHPSELQGFVDWIAEVDPESHPELFPNKDARLAYHLNAYNALAMHQVLVFDIPKKLSLLRRLSFFRLTPVRVGGKPISLEDYENTVIRKLGDPRVHAALNCMSESCPRLPRVPFAPGTLQAQLDHAARAFFSDPRNVRVDAAKRSVTLSEILKFFPEDFTAVAPSLIAYVNRFRQQAIPENYQVRFTPYDWTIIQQR